MRPQQNMQVKTLIVYSVSVSSGIKKNWINISVLRQLEHNIPQALFVFIPCGMYTIHFYNNITLLSHIPPYMKKTVFMLCKSCFCVCVYMYVCACVRASASECQAGHVNWEAVPKIVYLCLMFLSFQKTSHGCDKSISIMCHKFTQPKISRVTFILLNIYPLNNTISLLKKKKRKKETSQGTKLNTANHTYKASRWKMVTFHSDRRDWMTQ